MTPVSTDEIYEKYLQKAIVEINELAHAAMSSHDYSTFNFLQWYVAEQHEEEKLFKSVLDKLALVGTSGKGLFFIDKDLKKMGAMGQGGNGQA